MARRRKDAAKTLALFAFAHLDPDEQVVSSAALSAAALTGPGPQDPEAGRKIVLSQATETTDLARRSAMFAGLVGLADETTLAGC
jgi:hypothetical protein